MILSNTIAVPAFAVSIDIFGTFGLGYRVIGLVPTWPAGGFKATALLVPQFTATWDYPAPAAGGSLMWTVNTAPVQA